MTEPFCFFNGAYRTYRAYRALRTNKIFVNFENSNKNNIFAKLNITMGKKIHINFSTAELESWLHTVSDYTKVEFGENDEIVLNFTNILDEDISPAHIVSLACLIEHLDQKRLKVSVPAAHTNNISNYILTQLRFKDYWYEHRNHVVAPSESIFNLWRIVDSQKDEYSILVHNYLKRHFFQSKDLSAVQNSLIETYYNVFDHAKANNNAFTFVRFDESKQELLVATCDFGIGIANSVRTVMPELESDSAAIKQALEYKFTTKSQGHNKGMGLGNIKDTCIGNDILTIISGNGKVLTNYNKVETYDHNFSFPGTLIYYTLTLSHFEEEEVLDNFEL